MSEARWQPRVCAITMVYNEKVNLSRWIRYYGRQIGRENLIVINNDSDDGSVADISSVPNIRYPRVRFSDSERSDFISSLANSLLKIYDYVIYTDADEIIIAEPAKYKGIRHFLSIHVADAHTCIGFNVYERIGHDAPYDPSIPLLRQRRSASYATAMCKTSIVARPVSWLGGFHAANIEPNFSGLLLLHLKSAVYQDAKDRLQITRSLEWKNETKAGGHQRISDEQFDLNMNSRSKHDLTPLSEVVLDEIRSELIKNVKPIKRGRGDTLYHLEAPKKRWFVQLPEELADHL